MMTPQKRRTPTRAGQGFDNTHRDGQATQIDYSKASISALKHELAIILAAAHRMAAGQGLHFDDYDRLHIAHQHVLAVLAAISGREVLQ